VIVRLVLWSLADSKTTLAELRQHLGAASKRFGAVELWESPEAAEQGVPRQVRELIGKDPEVGETFDVEETI